MNELDDTKNEKYLNRVNTLLEARIEAENAFVLAAMRDDHYAMSEYLTVIEKTYPPKTYMPTKLI